MARGSGSGVDRGRVGDGLSVEVKTAFNISQYTRESSKC